MPLDSQLPTPDARLIQTETGSQPTPSSQGLPPDLLRQASRRLGLMCLIIAGLWAANFILAHLVQPAPVKMPDTAIVRLFDLIGAINIAASLGLFWYTRHQRSPRLLLNLGLVYELLIALSIGILDWAYNAPTGGLLDRDRHSPLPRDHPQHAAEDVDYGIAGCIYGPSRGCDLEGRGTGDTWNRPRAH